MITKKLLVASVVAALTLTGFAQAIVTIVYDPGTLYQTQALSGFTTVGSDMVGMAVTAYAVTGGSQTVAWAATGPGAGGALGTDWFLIESGDTYGGTWTLTNNTGMAFSRILIDAAPGDTVFDIDALTSTNGSANGWTFQAGTVPAGLDIQATYRNQVALTGDAPVGDLWAQLQLDFTSTGGFGAGQSLTFIADTDMADTAGDVRPVPAPGALLLAGIGTGLVGWMRRRVL